MTERIPQQPDSSKVPAGTQVMLALVGDLARKDVQEIQTFYCDIDKISQAEREGFTPIFLKEPQIDNLN